MRLPELASDLWARALYPGLIALAVSWVFIALAHATNGNRAMYLALAGTMAAAAIGFSFLGANTWWRLWELVQVLDFWRGAMFVVLCAGWAFTWLYLRKLHRVSRRRRHADDQGLD